MVGYESGKKVSNLFPFQARIVIHLGIQSWYCYPRKELRKRRRRKTLLIATRLHWRQSEEKVFEIHQDSFPLLVVCEAKLCGGGRRSLYRKNEFFFKGFKTFPTCIWQGVILLRKEFSAAAHIRVGHFTWKQVLLCAHVTWKYIFLRTHIHRIVCWNIAY